MSSPLRQRRHRRALRGSIPTGTGVACLLIPRVPRLGLQDQDLGLQELDLGLQDLHLGLQGMDLGLQDL